MTADELLERARVNATKAYCPHSKFHVGAVIELSDGTIIDGCNVENASYGLTICAERNALFQLPLVMKPNIIPIAMAISCPDLPDDFDPKFSMPCGACRQVMAEFFEKSTVIWIDRVGPMILSDLLPLPFKL